MKTIELLDNHYIRRLNEMNIGLCKTVLPGEKSKSGESYEKIIGFFRDYQSAFNAAKRLFQNKCEGLDELESLLKRFDDLWEKNLPIKN